MGLSVEIAAKSLTTRSAPLAFNPWALFSPGYASDQSKMFSGARLHPENIVFHYNGVMVFDFKLVTRRRENARLGPAS